MDIYILDEKLRTVDVIDSFESFIWTDRYNAYGDFELYLNATSEYISKLKLNYYLWRQDSEHLMVIEELKTQTDAENGKHLTITGRSLESLLERRICWNTVQLDGLLPGQIKKMLDQNAISPSDSKRKIENFAFEDTTDERISTIKINFQFTGDTLYDAVKKVCDEYDLGFRIILDKENRFVFQLYKGEDRSYAQNKNPYVVFSPNFDNMINSDYYESQVNWRNLTLVAGEGEGSSRKTLVVGDETVTGLHRRELYTDARDLSSKDNNGNNLSTAVYNEKLRQRGNEKLKEWKSEKSFEGQVETTQMYLYNKHFFMGDIVQIENEYSMQAKTRIMEYIRSENDSGVEAYPTFKIIEEEEVD